LPPGPSTTWWSAPTSPWRTGTHPLKGVKGNWQLFELADAAPAASTLRPR
jgi:hypothetical protein